MQLSKLENGFCYVQFRGNPAPNFKLSLRYVFGWFEVTPLLLPEVQ